jgi:glucose-6-phosphate isomerase
MLQNGENPMIYEVFQIPQESVEGMFNVCCTVLHPGKIGDEYFLTKGHFHKKGQQVRFMLGWNGKAQS